MFEKEKTSADEPAERPDQPFEQWGAAETGQLQ
jgi:hypothetical protein